MSKYNYPAWTDFIKLRTTMDKTFSILLDLTRFFAALLVFFHHSEQILKDNRLSPIASFGHDAVIFFFILSGFVIGYVSKHKEKNITDYSVARLARIYSVALPSLILVYVLYLLGNQFFPAVYADYTNPGWAKIFISSFAFINQSQWWSISVPTNGPYWSICYEVWYYVIFGIAFYVIGYKKYILLSVAILAAGPQILLLMPIWLLGFLCFTKHQKLTSAKPIGYLLIILSMVCYFGMRYANLDDALFHNSANIMGGEAKANELLGYSKRFAPDYVIAVLFVLFFSGIYIIREIFERIVIFCHKGIKLLSSYTFSLYLYHFPILLFLSALTDSSILAMSICLILIALLGSFSERKKPILAAFLKTLFNSTHRTA
jgi:peptidoglycan/LPS O-acetylase OafA/YrhL